MASDLEQLKVSRDSTQSQNFHGRRITGAGDAKDAQDYVTLQQMTANIKGQIESIPVVQPTKVYTKPSTLFLSNTHANRLANYLATTYPIGTTFYETDRTVYYNVQLVGGVKVWQYFSGYYSAATASKPVDLGTNDAKFEWNDTTLKTWERWTGAAWEPLWVSCKAPSQTISAPGDVELGIQTTTDGVGGFAGFQFFGTPSGVKTLSGYLRWDSENNNFVFYTGVCPLNIWGSLYVNWTAVALTNDARFGVAAKAPGLTAYANNAAALLGGLSVGDMYRTGADPDVICVVH